MRDQTSPEPVSCGVRKKSWREICSLLLNVDIVLCALIVASFATRLINLNVPSAVV